MVMGSSVGVGEDQDQHKAHVPGCPFTPNPSCVRAIWAEMMAGMPPARYVCSTGLHWACNAARGASFHAARVRAIA